MAVDTRNKRGSVVVLDLFGRVYPNPDGSLANALDRAHTAGKYAMLSDLPALDVDGDDLLLMGVGT